MASKSDAIKRWFFEALSARLASVCESMTGTRPAVEWEHLTAAPELGGLCWRQDFQGGPIRELAGVWIIAADVDWAQAGKQILLAAGIADSDSATLKSTYFEALGQALSGLAQDIGTREGYEVICVSGGESPQSARDAAWAGLHIRFDGGPVYLAAGVEQDLLESLLAKEPSKEALPDGAAESPLAVRAIAPGEASGGSKTFELLLDVELPVSISFGRAQVLLKDVLKLTTGSIVELNRSIAEPVEVIVNNCVIARGEVVVVEGNFGVRIHEVVSRQERLRTLT